MVITAPVVSHAVIMAWLICSFLPAGFSVKLGSRVLGGFLVIERQDAIENLGPSAYLSYSFLFYKFFPLIEGRR